MHVNLYKLMVVVLMSVSVASCANKQSKEMGQTITLQQAQDQAAAYARAAQAELPGRPQLTSIDSGSTDCDNAPKGQVDFGEFYKVDYGNPSNQPDNRTIFDQMYEYWSGMGYRVIKDTREESSARIIEFEDPRNGFWIELKEAAVGRTLSLNISAPCMWPNGTAPG
jgi:hypothetical protein